MLENSEEENYLKGLNRAIAVIKQKYHPFLQILMSNYAVNADTWFDKFEKNFDLKS